MKVIGLIEEKKNIKIDEPKKDEVKKDEIKETKKNK
jgi:hypothetical protein